MQARFPRIVCGYIAFAYLCISILFVRVQADPPVPLGETVVGDLSSCSVSMMTEVFSASSDRVAKVRIDSGGNAVGVECGIRARNMRRIYMGGGVSFSEGDYRLQYTSPALDAQLDAAGVGIGLSLFLRVQIPEDVELFGGMYMQQMHFLKFDLRSVHVSITDGDGKFDFSDFAKTHVDVHGSFATLGLYAGVKLQFGRATVSPLVALQSAVVKGKVKADMSAENLLNALDSDSLSSIDRSSTMFLSGAEVSWCSLDRGKYCFFGLAKGGLLAADHWAFYAQAGLKLYFP